MAKRFCLRLAVVPICGVPQYRPQNFKRSSVLAFDAVFLCRLINRLTAAESAKSRESRFAINWLLIARYA